MSLMRMGTLVCFNCCLTEQPPPKRRRPRLDPSMIGNPTDFRHTAHVGSRDMSTSSNENSRRLSALQNQMSSKGGYEYTSPVNVQLNVVDLPVHNHS